MGGWPPSASASSHALIGQYRKELDCNWAEVQREMRRALELNPASCVARIRYAASGLMPLGRLRAAAGQGYVPPSSIAWICLGLGETDDAFEWMDKAIEAHDPMMVPIKSYPGLDRVRSDPRFAALLRKMNLA